jgi:hypothetical protein
LLISVCALAACRLCSVVSPSLLSLGFVGEIGINFRPPTLVPPLVLSPSLSVGVLPSPCLPLSGVLTVVPSPVLPSTLSPPESRGVVPCTGAAILGRFPRVVERENNCR